jgi:hypothetical protein
VAWRAARELLAVDPVRARVERVALGGLEIAALIDKDGDRANGQRRRADPRIQTIDKGDYR